MYGVGIVGATGIVGEACLRILAERSFPLRELRLFASPRSAGRRLAWNGERLPVEPLAEGRFRDLDVVISSAGSEVARQWAARIAGEGAVVIDNSSAFRREPDVPLVIPEINAGALPGHRGIVANPNCTAAVALMAVAPLHRAARIRSMISSSYQSVTGTGRAAMEELLEQAGKALDQPEALRGLEPLNLPDPRVYPRHIAFNVFPQCETFSADADTSTEEEKLQAESRKILGDPAITVHATAVRVPVLVGHAVSLSLSTERPLSPAEARDLISGFPGVELVDRPWEGEFPSPLDCAGRDEVLVGRVRANPALPNGLSLFAAGDNLRKGAALNAIQIAEALLAG